jgi:hypothetical protein
LNGGLEGCSRTEPRDFFFFFFLFPRSQLLHDAWVEGLDPPLGPAEGRQKCRAPEREIAAALLSHARVAEAGWNAVQPPSSLPPSFLPLVELGVLLLRILKQLRTAPCRRRPLPPPRPRRWPP